MSASELIHFKKNRIEKTTLIHPIIEKFTRYSSNCQHSNYGLKYVHIPFFPQFISEIKTKPIQKCVTC